MDDKRLYYKLNTIFILLLLFPCVGFLYFANKYDLLRDNYIKLFIAVGLIYIFAGYTLLRKLFDQIISIAQTIKEKITKDVSADAVYKGKNELQQIVQSFNAIERQFRNSSEQLARKASEVSILKELADLCYVTLDPREILHVTLERALLLANADMGTVMIIDKDDPESLIVKASIGLADHIKIDEKIDFETSIAKYAIINKSPLIVEDIEKEKRFARTNRMHYGTKSFVIMPIKTIKDVIGVLTISRKETDAIFTQPDVESLAPLLSNAAFTYENIRLLNKHELQSKQVSAVRKIFKALNSSLRDSELLHTILQGMRDVLPFELAIVMLKDDKQEDRLLVINLQAAKTFDIFVGDRFNYQGTVLNHVMQQESIRIIDDLTTLDEKLDKTLFLDHGLKACILTPLTTGSMVNGVMAFFAENSAKFHESRGIAELMANTISFALEKSRLSATALRRSQELVAIKQIGAALASSTFDIKKVLNHTMDMIRTLMNVEAGSLALVQGEELKFAVSFDLDASELQKFRIKLGQGVCGVVASRGEPIIENHPQSSSSFSSMIDSSTGFVTRSILCVPMISQSRVIGVIEVLNKQEGGFDRSDKDILQSIAASVSIAIENARLYRKTAAMAEKERGIRGMFQKFVPKEIIDKIIHGTASDQAVIDEFKTITLLNLDIRGFSILTKEIGPQKSVALLNYFFSVMGGIVFKHHGIVDKYLGDGFLALFGAPVSSSKDADNAVSAALEMQRAVAKINEDYAMEALNTPVKIGVSLFTGEVVVGNIGFDMKMDYTVIGDPVNNVFRLQERTKFSPDSIVIAESTCRAAQTSLIIRELDGVMDGRKIYELLGRKEMAPKKAVTIESASLQA